MSRINRRNFFGWLSASASVAACSGVTQSSDLKAQADYDYIIVGSGAGGGPLAVNLAKAGFQVLLLEAGTDQGARDVVKVPAFHTQSTEDPEMAWDFYVDHFQKPAANQADSKYVAGKGKFYPRAGTLGGCTAHNAMITIYPLKSDWDQMAEDVGDASYDGDTMRAYFQLCEKAQYLEEPSRKKGWLPVSLPDPRLVIGDSAILALLYQAWRKFRREVPSSLSAIQSLLQIVSNTDTNADSEVRDAQEGLVMIPLATTPDGKRYSTRDLVLSQVGKGLTLRTSALVSKVLFDETGPEPRAIGVEYIVGDKIYQASPKPNPASTQRQRVYARSEVILAGGTFNTPQLLMASGIGPRAELSKFEESSGGTYKVLVDRPGVGRNLQDRYEVGVVSEADYPLSILDGCRFTSTDDCHSAWQQGFGPYTSSGGIIGMMKKSKPTLASPDLFMFLLPTDFHGYFPGYSKVVASSKQSVTWAVLKSHTSNRAGTVKLKDLNPTSRPLINFNNYEDGTAPDGSSYGGNLQAEIDDLEAVVTGVEFVRDITERASSTLSFFDFSSDLPKGPQPLQDRYFTEVVPGPRVTQRSALREWVRRNSWGHHACGSCKMGRDDDPMAVVNARFEVIGVSGLRVVDASIFPRIPGYFIASSVYTISERASDEILASRGLPRRVSV